MNRSNIIIKHKGFDPSPVAGKIPMYADSINNPKSITTSPFREFWEEQIDRCMNGYITAGMNIPGRYYYYLNFVPITGLIAGRQYPWYVDLDYEYFKLVDYVKEYQKPGIIAPKARRKGLSEKGKTILSHGLRFTQNYRGAITAGLETYVNGLRKKFEDVEYNIVPELSLNYLKNNDKVFQIGYRERSEMGTWVDRGYGGMISFETMYDDAKKLEGEYFHDVICEESGRYKLLGEVIESIKPAIQMGSSMLGTFLIYGCVCEGTKVWNNKGELINVEDIQQSEGIIGFGNGGYSREPINHMNPPMKKECYRIETISGRFLECSHDHPILWSNKGYLRGPHSNKRKAIKFVEAENIKTGDQIAVIDEVPIFGKLKMWEPRLLGWLVGDGSYGFDKTPVLSSCDFEITQSVHDNFNAITEKFHVTKENKIYKEIRIKEITKYLRHYGIYGQTKDKKRLPKYLHSATHESITEFLGGLFDTNGHVNCKKGGIRITLTSISKEMLLEVQMILQKLGIHGRIMNIKASDKSLKGGQKMYYRLEVRDERSIQKFYDQIRFHVQYKQLNLENIISQIENKPVSIRKSKPVIMNKGVDGLRFERVVSIEPIGKKKIYNLTAGNTNTYVANGIVTHNTGGNILSTSRDFKEYWDEAENLGFERFYVPGNRMYYPFFSNPVTTKPFYDNVIKKTVDPIPNLRDYEPWQVIGCEDTEAAKENILERRKAYAKMKNRKKLKELNQHLPLTIEETFTSGGSNNFNDELIYSRLFDIEGSKRNYKEMVIERIVKKGEDGLLEKTMDVVARPATKNDPDWKIVLVYQEPVKSIIDLDVAGIDSYNQDQTQTGRSLGAMVVLREGHKISMEDRGIHYAEYPVCLYYKRPPRKEQFYETCLNIAIWYGLRRNVMASAEQDFVIDYFKKNGGEQFLSPRPKSFDVKGSKQSHQYGAKFTGATKPIILGVTQSWVDDWVQYCNFVEILRDLLAYDEEFIGTDWDSVDALALAKMRAEDMNTRPRNRHDMDIDEDAVIWYQDNEGNMRVKDPVKEKENKKNLRNESEGNWVSLNKLAYDHEKDPFDEKDPLDEKDLPDK